jgi:hypothetical protein
MSDTNVTQRDASSGEVVAFFDSRFSRQTIAFCIDNGISASSLVGCDCCADRPRVCWADNCENLCHPNASGFCDDHADQRYS